MVDAFDEAYEKFMSFIQTSSIYRVDRLFGLLPPDGMHHILNVPSDLLHNSF